MLKTEKISKKFYTKQTKVDALSYVSVEINKGEFVSITGKSGSGKSTLLLALGGMSSPHSGKVLWNGESVFDWSNEKRAQWRAKTIGFVFQTFNLVPYLTVYENVKIALSLSGKSENGEKRVADILKQLGLSDRKDHLPRELSVGQQQRVALARVLVKDPEMILADEPTGNLDPQTASEILAVIKNAKKEGKTVVLITHDPGIAQMADRIIRIEDGEIKNIISGASS